MVELNAAAIGSLIFVIIKTPVITKALQDAVKETLGSRCSARRLLSFEKSAQQHGVSDLVAKLLVLSLPRTAIAGIGPLPAQLLRSRSWLTYLLSCLVLDTVELPRILNHTKPLL